jgi:uncharacterized protein (TIRG00374 family)
MTRYVRWAPRLIGPAILVYFLLTTDLAKIVGNLRVLRWAPLLVSLALYPVMVALKTWRWAGVMRSLGLAPPRLSVSMRLYMIGLFLGGATPGQSGDFLKAWYLREYGQPLVPTLLSILLDRLFDFLIMAMLSLLGLSAFLHRFPERLRAPIQIGSVGLAAATGLMILVLMARRPRDWLMRQAPRLTPSRAHAALERWRGQLGNPDARPTLVASLLLATACSAAVTIARLWLLFTALDVGIPILALVSSIALISVLQVLPISFAGVGVRDAVLVAVLAVYSYGRDKALALSALFLLINLEHILIGFLVSLRHPVGQGPAGTPQRAQPSAAGG